MCLGVAPSGLPMPKSMMSSPRARAAAFISPVMLKTYGGSRFRRRNSCMGRVPRVLLNTLISIAFHFQRVPNRGNVRGAPRFQSNVDYRVTQIDAVVGTVVERLHNVCSLIV